MMYKTVLVAAMFLQWHGFPTPGIARTADGKPNLSAPLPRAADGKADLSGIWMATRPRFNVAQSLKGGDSVPFQPWAKAVFANIHRLQNRSKTQSRKGIAPDRPAPLSSPSARAASAFNPAI